MKKEQIKQFIESVAEVKELAPVSDPYIRSATSPQEVLYDGETIIIDKKYNPTLGYKLLKYKEQIKPCELNCGVMVSNQVIERRRVETPEPHWITKCQNCKGYLHPNGTTIIEGAHKIQSAYVRHFKYKGK